MQSLTTYRSSGSASESSPTTSASAPAADGASGLKRALEERRLVEVQLDYVVLDGPVLDGFSRRGSTITDYRWALETWNNVVRPGVESGLDREAFERRDAARSVGENRKTASVYDLFLGDTDRLLFSRRSDGSLEVVNGRHRVELARRMGIDRLPGQVS
jgi:hypothetical protein